MEVKRIVVGYLEENCYLVIHEKDCLLIDPGGEEEKIVSEINDLKVDGILITHRHFDHIGALDILQKKYSVPIYDFASCQEKGYDVGPFHFEVSRNPGHSEDSIRFVFPKEHWMFVGDFVFASSIGRTDLEGGSMKKMEESIKKLLEEKDNYVLYPGHGESTTLEKERKTNPFFLPFS